MNKCLQLFILFSFLLLADFVSSQNNPDSLAKDSSITLKEGEIDSTLFKKFHWEKVKENTYRITVENYDSLKIKKTDLELFYYNAEDKPNCKMIVENEKGKKLREFADTLSKIAFTWYGVSSEHLIFDCFEGFDGDGRNL